MFFLAKVRFLEVASSSKLRIANRISHKSGPVYKEVRYEWNKMNIKCWIVAENMCLIMLKIMIMPKIMIMSKIMKME